MNNNCDTFFESLNEYLDKTISTEDQTLLEEHLSNCKSCTQELKELEFTIKTIKTLDNIKLPETRENFSEDIIAQLRQENLRYFNSNILKRAVAVIVVVLITALIGIKIKNDNHNVAINQPDKNITTEYVNDIDELIYEKDNSILAEAGFPTDQWGLLDLDRL